MTSASRHCKRSEKVRSVRPRKRRRRGWEMGIGFGIGPPPQAGVGVGGRGVGPLTIDDCRLAGSPRSAPSFALIINRQSSIVNRQSQAFEPPPPPPPPPPVGRAPRAGPRGGLSGGAARA